MSDIQKVPPKGTQYEIWVHLFETGSPTQIGKVAVEISATTHVAAFRAAIQDKWKNSLLRDRDAAELVVKATRDGAPLTPETRIWRVLFELNVDKERQAYVEVPPKPERAAGTFREIPPPGLNEEALLFERENSAWELADSLLSPEGTKTAPIWISAGELERPVWLGNFEGFFRKPPVL